MSQIRRRQIGGKVGGSPLPEGSYWIDNNGLKFTVLADNTTVEVSSGGGSWLSGLYIPGEASDKNMTAYDSGGNAIPCGNYTYAVKSIAQDGFAPTSINNFIEVAEGITTIKSRAFRASGYNTANEIWIKFPDSVKTYGDGVFTRFSKITKLKLGCPSNMPGYSFQIEGSMLRLIVIDSTAFTFVQNSFRTNDSYTNHEINIVFPNITVLPSRPYNHTNPFSTCYVAYSIYLPDALVAEAKASWLGETTYGVGADYIYPISEYTVDANHPDYNF